MLLAWTALAVGLPAEAKRPPPPRPAAPAPAAPTSGGTSPAPVVARWVDAPGPDQLPAGGAVAGAMDGRRIEITRVAFGVHVPAPGDRERKRTVVLYLEQVWGGTGPGSGAVQVWLDLPADLKPGTYASGGPVHPVFAQLGADPTGADVRSWPSAEVSWVLEVTAWDVTEPTGSLRAGEDLPIGTATGRIAVYLRDGWGGATAGHFAGAFVRAPVLLGLSG